MPTHVILMNLTEQGVKNVKDAPARVEEAAKALEAAGGKLLAFYRAKSRSGSGKRPVPNTRASEGTDGSNTT